MEKIRESGLMADCKKFFTLPKETSVADYLLRKCRGFSQLHHPCITNPVTGESVEYWEIEHRSAQVASYLLENGMRPGDVLINLSHDGAKLHTFFIGVWRISGIVRCSYPEDVGEILTSRIVESRAKFVLCDESSVTDCLVAVEAAATVNGRDSNFLATKVIVFGKTKTKGCVSVDEDIFQREQKDFKKVDVSKDDIALLLPTSGTTGESKAVIYTHEILMKNILLFEKFPFTDNPSCFTLVTGKQTHFTGSVCPLSFMAAGRPLLMMGAVSQENILLAVQKYCVRSIFSFPKFLMGLVLDPQASGYDLSSIAFLITAGMVIGPSFVDTVKKLKELKAVMTIYGMTEVGFLTSNVHWIENSDGNIYASIDDSQVLSSGRLGPSSELQVRDVDTGKFLQEAGKKGELCFRSQVACPGYWKNDKATASTFRDGWVYTGDLGYFDSNGNIFVLNRLKEVFKYYNNHITPIEIENVILLHPCVEEACVIGVPDPEGGDMVPRAFVTTKKNFLGKEAVQSPDDILEFANSKVASYKKLRGGLFILPDFPRGKSGKILKNVLTTLQVQQLPFN